jgi:hypothetical protein
VCGESSPVDRKMASVTNLYQGKLAVSKEQGSVWDHAMTRSVGRVL